MGKPKPPPPASLTSEQRDRAIAKDYENDRRLSEIQDEYNVSPGYIYRILEKHGIAPRRAAVRSTSAGLTTTVQPQPSKKSDAVTQAINEVEARKAAERKEEERKLREALAKAQAAQAAVDVLAASTPPVTETLTVTDLVQPVVSDEAPGYR